MQQFCHIASPKRCRARTVTNGAAPPIECEAGHRWWKPNSVPQALFLRSSAHEILYGGEAGGGKSAALVMLPLRWRDHPYFSALVLRRETTQLEELIKQATDWYTKLFPGVRSKQIGSGVRFTFPRGATILYTHCKEVADAFNYQGREFQVVEFDELTHFEWEQYQELKSRCRSPHRDLPRYLRTTSNPGGKGHEWVMKRWGAWLDPRFEAEGIKPRFDEAGNPVPPYEPGQVAYLARDGAGTNETYISREEVIERRSTPTWKQKTGIDYIPTTRQFIAAGLKDNVHLSKGDPNYERSLRDLDPVRQAQLREGNWLVKPSAGLYFKRAWIHILDELPKYKTIRRVRSWDLASTENGGDWTVGVRIALLTDAEVKGRFYKKLWVVEDVRRGRWHPSMVEQTIVNTAKFGEPIGVMVTVPQDPGQAGKAQVSNYATLLSGIHVKFILPSGDKITRAGPCSSQCAQGNLMIIRGPWNKDYLDCLEGFPEAAHDDDVDATADGFNETNIPLPPRGDVKRPLTGPG